MSPKVVICGAGFLGSSIARIIATSNLSLGRRVQISSRKPDKLHTSLKRIIPEDALLPPVPLNITKPESLIPAFKDADVVVSLVGLMHGSPRDFEEIQWKGAENVANATREVGAKLIHISAIGADSQSTVPYARTKGLAEISALRICPDATIVRPSIVFGPDDDFFSRFSRMSRFLPFLPVFAGGQTLFQPVYVDDLARAIEIISRDEKAVRHLVSGKIVEAGGPKVHTYKELMQLVLKYNHRHRFILSLPFSVGMLQGAVMERLPLNLFTVTRAQVEQLKSNNIVNKEPTADQVSFEHLIQKYSVGPLKSVDDILPLYL